MQPVIDEVVGRLAPRRVAHLQRAGVHLLVRMVWGVSTRTVDCCLRNELQTSNLPGPPHGGTSLAARKGGSGRAQVVIATPCPVKPSSFRASSTPNTLADIFSPGRSGRFGGAERLHRFVGSQQIGRFWRAQPSSVLRLVARHGRRSHGPEETHQLGRQGVVRMSFSLGGSKRSFLLRPVPVRLRARTVGRRWSTQRRAGRLDPIHHLGSRHRLTLRPDLCARPGSAPAAALPALAPARRS